MSDSYASSRNGDATSVGGQSVSGIAPVIRKKLMGFVGFANLPNQVHRKSVRKGFQFTAMVVGQFLFFAAFRRRNPSQASRDSESRL